ncbi:hypothetical protein ACJMK2_042837 [Sinanodonta woodiana]|uniref:Centromere protein H C-terminal domain-containing protein n=1 Tax=Sinanodonta woodiana TaxID=1069815 RepID=A0ABD3VV27_SINWO
MSVAGTPELMNISPLGQSQKITPEGFTVSPLTANKDFAGNVQDSFTNKKATRTKTCRAEDGFLYHDWLKAQVLQHKAELLMLSDPEYGKFDSMTKEELQEIMPKLKKDLVIAASVHGCQNRVMKSLYFTKTIEQIMYGTDVSLGSGDSAAESEKRRHLEELFENSCRTVTELGQVQQELERLQDEYIAIKKKNFELMKKSRQLYAELQARKQTKEDNIVNLSQDQESRRLSDQYKNTVQKITILKETLQGLILGSGVNWMQDEKLAKLVELLA